MSSKRKNKRHQRDVDFLTHSLESNTLAITEGPQKKTWSHHDLINLTPLTHNQKEMFQEYFQGKQICAYGSAGTGKSLIGLFLGIKDVISHNQPQTKLIIIRSAVPSRDLGFLPGTIEEKMALYELPYVEMFRLLFNHPTSYKKMKDAGLVEFMTTSYIRGLTWDDAIVILDEVQNCSWHEINSVMTRLGKNSRIIFTGDSAQTDLHKRDDKSGIDQLIRVANKMSEFSVIQFVTDDIVRSPLVKSWIIATQEVLRP